MPAASWSYDARLVTLALLLGGCDAVLGLQPWDAEPGATSSSASSSSSASGGGGAPAGSSTSGGGDEPAGSSTSGGGGGGCAPGACGTCELGCWSEAACVGGVCTPVVLASGELANIPQAGGLLAVAGDHLVWIDATRGVRRTRKSTASIDTLLAGPIEQPSGLATSTEPARVVYSNANGILQGIALEPGDEVPIASPVGLSPEHLVTVADDVMWLAGGVKDERAGVYRSSRDVPDPIHRVSVPGIVSFAPLKGAVYYVRQDAAPGLWRDEPGDQRPVGEPGRTPLIVLADHATEWVYVACDEVPGDVPPQVLRSKGSPPWESVAETGTAVVRLVLGGEWLYWIDAERRLVAAAAEPGRADVQVIADERVTALAADEDGVYWADDSNRIWGLRRSPP